MKAFVTAKGLTPGELEWTTNGSARELPGSFETNGDVLDGIREKFAGRIPAAMWDEEARCLHRGILAFGADGKFLARNRDLPLPGGGEVRFHLPLSGG